MAFFTPTGGYVMPRSRGPRGTSMPDCCGGCGCCLLGGARPWWAAAIWACGDERLPLADGATELATVAIVSVGGERMGGPAG
jgi:hypothetical protein